MVHRLPGAAAIAIDGDAFALHLVSLSINEIHLVQIGVVGEVYGFGDGGVAVLLEGGLHAKVPDRFYVVGTDKDFFDIFGDLVAFG